MRKLLLLVLTLSSTARAADSWMGLDKALHFGASAGLAGAGYALGAAWFDEPPARLHVGALFALGLGLTKEVWDVAHTGEASFRDLAWDAAGVLVGLLVGWCVDRLLFAEPSTVY